MERRVPGDRGQTHSSLAEQTAERTAEHAAERASQPAVEQIAIPPPGESAPPPSWLSHVRVKLAEAPAEWAGAVAVRLAVFVDEQHVPLAAEMDEHDRSALHAVAVLDPTAAAALASLMLPARSGVAMRAAAQAGKYLPLSLSGARGSLRDTGTMAAAVGTGRLLRAAGGVARIGRMAVLPAWRGHGVGSRLLRLLEEAALARGAHRVVVHAQEQAQGFYARQGYTTEPPATVFLEDNIPHVRMAKPLSLDM